MDLTPGLNAALTSERRRIDADTSGLVGSRCSVCGTASWPSRAVCQQCGSTALGEEVFASAGTLVTHTTAHVPRPGLDAPYMLGQVQLDGRGPLVFGVIRDLPPDAPVPAPVRTVLGDGEGLVYWFQPQ